MQCLEQRQKKFIRELAEKSRVRRETGLFLVDGPKMCAEIPDGLLKEVYVTEAFLGSPHAKTCGSVLMHGYTKVSDVQMKQMSDTVSPQGILCIVKQPELKGIRGLMEAADGKTPLLVILETLQDPGNLGTIIRASEAAGVTGIILNSTSADVYSPKTVRATMGSVFRVPTVTVHDLVNCVKGLKEGVHTGGAGIDVYAACLNGSEDYTAFNYTKPCAFMIGNESNGLSEELISEATHRILIPMEGSVESLNAAMAAAVIGFEAYRQRRLSWQV